MYNSSPKQNPSYLFKAVVLGDCGVGKTSLINQFVRRKFLKNYKATIGADFLTKNIQLDDGKNVTLQIWDTAGQEKFQSLGVAFYRGSDCCILVFDVTSHSSFRNLDTWYEDFLEQAMPADPDNFSFVLIGNKTDLINMRTVSSKSVLEWCKIRNDMPYLEVSVKESVNVDEAFMIAIESVMLREKDRQINYEEIPNPIKVDEFTGENITPGYSCQC